MHNNFYFENPYQRLFYDRAINLPIFGFLARNNAANTGFNLFCRHLPLNAFMFFLIIATFTFGPGYQPIAFFFFPGMLFTVAFTRSVPSAWIIPLLVFPSISFGIFFAYAGSFTDGSPWESHDTLYMIPVALLIAALVSFVLFMDRAIACFSLMMLHFIEVFFAFPMLWAGLWCILSSLGPFGDFGSWGYAVPLMGLDKLTVGFTWLFGAIPGCAYAFGLMISSTLYLTRRYIEIYNPEKEDEEEVPLEQSVRRKQLIRDTKDLRLFFLHPIAFVLYIIIAVYAFGTIWTTFGPEAKFFYQVPIAQWAPKTVETACLINPSLQSTDEFMKTSGANSKFVIWSERSVNVTNETVFLQQAMAVSKKYGVYLGVSYGANVTNNPRYTSRNMFALIVPPNPNNKSAPATVGLLYQKVNVVPGVENQVQPGHPVIPYYDTPYGRVGVAIGFDFEFPFMQAAYNNQIAIMFQPTWNWGATGILHAEMNRVRAVEFGFTLVRCASNGVSGVFDQFYRILMQQLTTNTGSFVYNVPLFGWRWSLFRVMPDFLAIACMAVFAFWIVFLIIFGLRRFYKQMNPRVKSFPKRQQPEMTSQEETAVVEVI